MAKAPHYFIHGNLIFGSGPEDAWAVFRLDGQSYPGLSTGRKLELKEQIETFAYAIESDFQIIRSARQWSARCYLERALATLDPRRGDREAFRRYLEGHKQVLGSRETVRHETYLVVRLAGALNAAPAGERIGELWRSLQRAVGLSDARGLSDSDLAELRRLEERTFDRVFDHLPCERARSGEIAELIRGSYVRGVADPRVDSNWKPQALWVEGAGDGDGEEARFEPFTHDLHRLHESRVGVESRALRVETEDGISHQALLVAGALPDESSFPGSDVELMFSPLEAGFPVDAVFSCEWLPNKNALKLAQKRMVDADQQAKEEAHGEHGPSVTTDEKTYAARELQQRLAGSDRPPFLRSALTLAVGAPTAEVLEERVERLRSEFGRVELHRPLGEQHRLFVGAMPAQSFPVSDYKSHLLPEQLGAMVPTATSTAGSEIGPYIGHALTGSRSPVQFDLAEACRTNRPSTVLLTGGLGSGKTMCLETFYYQAALQGSWPIFDVDPKGDHALERLPGMAERMETIELGPDERYRGLLDPMRIGTDENREELTTNFLLSILPPSPLLAHWETEISAAVGIASQAGARNTGAVMDELARGEEGSHAADVHRALSVHLKGGLAQLGYGETGAPVLEVGSKQIISLRIRNLTLPIPGTARSELESDERVSQAVLRLVAAYAMRMCSADTSTHAVLGLDEAWSLLSDSQGRALITRLSRMGRSMNITPILASQIVGDASDLEALVGSYLAFGVETSKEAAAALELLGLDAEDEATQQRLRAFRQGRCYLRYFDGGTIPMRIDPGEELLDALDTTPKREEEIPTDDDVDYTQDDVEEFDRGELAEQEINRVPG